MSRLGPPAAENPSPSEFAAPDPALGPGAQATPGGPLTHSRIAVWAGVAWLLFAVGNLVFSGHNWMWLIPGLLPPVTFLAVPVVLAVIAVARQPTRRLVWLAVVGLVVGVPQSGLNPAAFGTADVAVPAGAVRVFSWNAEVWNDGDDPAQFYRFLLAQRADVYLLQEFAPTDYTRLQAAFPDYTPIARGELLTLTRLPVTSTRDLPGPPPSEDWRSVYEHVKALRVDVRAGNQTLSLYNVHLPIQLDLRSPLRPSFYSIIRDRDAARRTQLRGLTRDIDGNTAPILLAGDLNTSPAMGDIRVLTSRLHSATPANRSLYPVSWNDHWAARLWRLDWAFTSTAVRVHRYEFLDAGDMSDHRGQELLVTVEARS